MASRPRVGVTGGAAAASPSYAATALALRAVGARPHRISVRHAPPSAPLDALVVGGGDDIGPEHYQGDLEGAGISDPARDALEIACLREALDRRIPILGICRGAQLLNVVRGGDLHRDIRHLRRHARHRASVLPTKDVVLRPTSRLADVCRARSLRVNRLHHQAVRRLGRGLRVVAVDRDGIVQAIEAPDRPWLGVQWHPEYLAYLPAQLALFRWVARRAAARAADSAGVSA